jgi:hypothetical protein
MKYDKVTINIKNELVDWSEHISVWSPLCPFHRVAVSCRVSLKVESDKEARSFPEFE